MKFYFREQLAIADFAKSLLVIPKTLTVNAAQDSSESNFGLFTGLLVKSHGNKVPVLSNIIKSCDAGIYVGHHASTALELIPSLVQTLNWDIQAPVLQEILQVLEGEAYPIMLEQIQKIISKEAHVAKSSAAMKLQRCFAIRDGINGLLDVARKTYCDLVIEMETLVKDFAQEQGLPIRVGFNATRGYHMQVQKSFLLQIKGRNFKIKQLPEEFINPKMCKSMVTFTTEALIRADQQSQVCTDIFTNELFIAMLECLPKCECKIFEFSR